MVGKIEDVVSALEAHLQARKKEIAILVIDPQWDFTEFGSDILAPTIGALPVPGADLRYMQTVNELTLALKQRLEAPVWITQDWHSPEHCSFPAEGRSPFVDTYRDACGKTQRVWPMHAVANTPGALPFLQRDLIDHVFYKGENPNVESYSAFRDESGQWTGLADQLHQAGRKILVVYGLATDFCVLHTILDARELSFEVWWIQAGSRGIFIRDSQSPEQVEYEILQQMRTADVHIL
jgi:nicotinamidase/pyrazinamidase